jgi:hypothetical protein
MRKLAVFDVNEAKIVHYIGIAEDSIRFAAGKDRILVILPGSKIIQRWGFPFSCKATPARLRP